MRIGRAKSNAADNSCLVRDSSAGTGSRLRSSRVGRSIWTWVWSGWGGGRFGRRQARINVRPLSFQNDLIKKSPAVAHLKFGGEHITFARLNRGKCELKTVGAARAIPSVALLIERFEISDPRVDDAIAAPLRAVRAKLIELEHDSAGSFC